MSNATDTVSPGRNLASDRTGPSSPWVTVAPPRVRPLDWPGDRGRVASRASVVSMRESSDSSRNPELPLDTAWPVWHPPSAAGAVVGCGAGRPAFGPGADSLRRIPLYALRCNEYSEMRRDESRAPPRAPAGAAARPSVPPRAAAP